MSVHAAATALLVLLVIACSGPSATPTPTAAATSTPTVEPLATSTTLPVPSSTEALSATPTPTATFTPEPTSTPMATNTPLPTWTPVPTWTPEPTWTPAPTATPDLRATATRIPNATSTPIDGQSSVATATRSAQTATPVVISEPAAGDTGEWWAFDYENASISWRSISLEAYETGYGEGSATLSVTCFNSPNLGKYPSVSIRWESYVTSRDDRSAHLNWDDGPTEFESWDGSSDGDSVSPQWSRTHRYDREFITRLGQYRHLDFAVESLDGWHRAKFQLDGFAEAYKPVVAFCA